MVEQEVKILLDSKTQFFYFLIINFELTFLQISFYVNKLNHKLR